MQIPFVIDRWIRSRPEWFKAPLHASLLLARGMPRQAWWPFKASILQFVTMIANQIVMKPERECLACGWTGWRFLPDWDLDKLVSDTLCPRCGSFSRYHLYFWWLRSNFNLYPGCVLPLHVLEVAPKPCSIRFFHLTVPEGHYLSVDLNSSLAMSRQDVTSLSLRDGMFDLVLCSHVLDYVPNDVTAMAELYRVMRKGGRAIVQVSVDWALPETLEYHAARPEEDDHIRRYGRDYIGRLESVGFRTQIIHSEDLMDQGARDRHGVKPDYLLIAYKD